MHELTLARSVVEIALEQARAHGASRVRRVRLALGALSHVEPRALALGFEAVAKGTLAEGARLAIDRLGGRAFCADCEDSVAIGAYGEPCPRCGGFRWTLTAGGEMRVVDMEVE